MIMALVGNKADLHDNRSVSSQVCIYIFLKEYVALLMEILDAEATIKRFLTVSFGSYL